MPHSFSPFLVFATLVIHVHSAKTIFSENGPWSGSVPRDVVKSYKDLGGKPYSVSYNKRSMLVDGKPVLLLSGSVHYVRSTPAMWPKIFAKMKAAGMNAVESYVFWNFHVRTLEQQSDPDYGKLYPRANVTLFLDLAAKFDLFVIWRIGPYVCAEWPGGGMPSWLRQVGPGMHPRSATQPYQDTCYRWMHSHIEFVRPHFAANGGPVIMLQVRSVSYRWNHRVERRLRVLIIGGC